VSSSGDSLKELPHHTPVTEEQGNGVSRVNTEIHLTVQKPEQDNASLSETPEPEEPEERVIETTPTGDPLLFESTEEGRVAKPSAIVHYLKAIEQSSDWDLSKLRRLKNKQLTYLKKAPDKRKGEPPLPITVKEYMVDWTPSEALESLNNTGSTGKSWWIQRLPQDSEARNQLINARRRSWVVHEQQ
jgi:hypothetical protein